MKCTRFGVLFPCLVGVLFLIPGVIAGQAVLAPSPVVEPGHFTWNTVVNNAVQFPGDTRKFNSYNEPSINVNQLVVFRARSKGGSGSEPAHGIFTRNMATEAPLMPIFDRNMAVPQPNNLGSTFVEPPSFPRIDMFTDTIASRGNHAPVWKYLLPGGITETRAGTTGIYTNPFGTLITGASNLGAVPGFSFFEVPGSNGIKFDVFPGAPSVTEGNIIVFKGNYSVPDGAGGTISKTGAYFRILANGSIKDSDGNELSPAAGDSPVVVIADTDTPIPHTRTGKTFGSVAPPSAAGRWVVFAGFDNEDNPTEGGIYLAPLGSPRPQLRPLVEIGGLVPGEKGRTVFNKLSEGLSFDGRYVAFWGAWGTETKNLTLQCPEEGNKDRVAYCKEQNPQGYPAKVPLHQGIFVYDTTTGGATIIAKSLTGFDDFVYWKFTGVPPGVGQSDEPGEPARWRSSTFMAVSGLADENLKNTAFHVAFEARTGQVAGSAYANPVDGIYLFSGPTNSAITTVAETGTDGRSIDPQAVVVDEETGESVVPLITGLGLERDSFRGRSLVINVAMGTEDTGWAGIYLTTVP